jgi:hypothetical protein
MPKIYSDKEPLLIDRVSIAKPVNKNGSHFIKIHDIDDPIYFLAPKCFTKQGFVSHGKKTFCDFVFRNDNSEFFSWLENLEEKVKAGIFENREKWFETPLDEHDIESSMTPPYKPYKSGKFFIIRANVPTALGKINIKVYDEHEEETEPESIKENTNVLAVLEFQGIRCGVRSFQFEIELKQILIVEPEKIFEKCVITKPSVANAKPAVIEVAQPVYKIEEDTTESQSTVVKEKNIEDLVIGEVEPVIENMESLFPSNPLVAETSVAETAVAETDLASNIVDLRSPEDAVNPQRESPSETHMKTTQIEILDDAFPLDSFNAASLDEPPIRLKSRNDVYYKLYKETRQRAREAKREALANYLEAKRIKTTYLLEDASDSDSDLDELESDI